MNRPRIALAIQLLASSLFVAEPSLAAGRAGRRVAEPVEVEPIPPVEPPARLERSERVEPIAPEGGSGVAATTKLPQPSHEEPKVHAFASIEKGAGLERPDGLFSIAFHFVAQPRLDWNSNNVDSSDQLGFRFNLLRTQLRGNFISRKLKYFFQAEFAGQPALVDMEFFYEAHHWANIHFGQFITPFSREFLVPPFRLLFPDFSPSNVFFRDGRQRGVMVEGKSAGGLLSYAVSLTNVNGIGNNTVTNEKDHLLTVGRLALTPWGVNGYSETPTVDGIAPGLTFGVNGSFARQDLPIDPSVPNGLATHAVLSLGADAELHLSRLSIEGEVYARRYRQLDDATGFAHWAAGGYLQAGVMLVPKRLELGIRHDVLAPSSRSRRGRSNRSEAVLGYYIKGSHLKMQLRYAYTDAEAGNPIIRAGATHGLTLQTQLFF